MIAMPEWTPLLLWVFAGLAGVLLSGAYSGMEIGCYRLSEVRLRLEAQRRGGAWRRLLELNRRRDRLICIVLIGNSLADYLASGSTTYLFTKAGFSAYQTEFYTTLVLGPALFVVGEMVPKALFQARADVLTVRGTWLLEASRVLFTASGLLGAVQWATRGVLRLFGRETESAEVLAPRERIRAILLDQTASGLLSTVQLDVARNVLDIRDIATRAAMTPMVRAALVSENASREAVEEAASGNEYSRLLVHAAGNRRKIAGFVNVIEVLLAEEGWARLEPYIRPVVHLDADQSVSASLVTLREARCPIGVVDDHRGDPIGIVTMKDLVEQIVGDVGR